MSHNLTLVPLDACPKTNLVVSDVFTLESFESDHSARGHLTSKEIAVASDGFNGTLLILFFLLYEYALSFLFSLNCDCHLLVDDCIRAKPAEHDAAIAFSNHQ